MKLLIQRRIIKMIRKTEETIEKLENRLSEIDQEMALPENISNAEALTKLSEEAAEKNAELEQLYALWEELSI
jgi:ATP-binding cassette subfamily F protein 3